MRVTVHHYGAFRECGNCTDLDILLPATIQQIRAALSERLGVRHKLLIDDSAFSNDTDILSDEYIVEEEEDLSILPPVCGG